MAVGKKDWLCENPKGRESGYKSCDGANMVAACCWAGDARAGAGEKHDVTASVVPIPSADIAARFAVRLPECKTLDMVPGERFAEAGPITESTLIACVLVHGLKLCQELTHRFIN